MSRANGGMDTTTAGLWGGLFITLLLAAIPMSFWPRSLALVALSGIIWHLGWNSPPTRSLSRTLRSLLILIGIAILAALFSSTLRKDWSPPHLELTLTGCPGIHENARVKRLCVRNNGFPSISGVMVSVLKLEPIPPGIGVFKFPLHIAGGDTDESEARIDKDDHILIDVVEYRPTNPETLKLWHALPKILTYDIPRQDYKIVLRITANGDIPAINETLFIGCQSDGQIVLLRDKATWVKLRKAADVPSCTAS